MHAGKGTTVEVLAFMGLFGLVLSSVQAAVLEREAVANVSWTPQVWYHSLHLQACSANFAQQCEASPASR